MLIPTEYNRFHDPNTNWPVVDAVKVHPCAHIISMGAVVPNALCPKCNQLIRQVHPLSIEEQLALKRLFSLYFPRTPIARIRAASDEIYQALHADPYWENVKILFGVSITFFSIIFCLYRSL